MQTLARAEPEGALFRIKIAYGHDQVKLGIAKFIDRFRTRLRNINPNFFQDPDRIWMNGWLWMCSAESACQSLLRE